MHYFKIQQTPYLTYERNDSRIELVPIAVSADNLSSADQQRLTSG
jgi:hypothetical protein